jgi:ketosteroid isomerase-like protein
VSSKRVNVIEDVAKRFNAGDVDGILELYDVDAVIRSGRAYKGREEMREHFEELLGQFRNARLDVEDIHEAGDVLIMEALLEGETPDGTHVSLPMTLVFEMENTHIREQRAYADPGVLAGLLQGASVPEPASRA